MAESTPPGERYPVEPFSERKGSEILESIADPVVAFDRQYRFTYVSRRAYEVLGKAYEDLICRCIWDVYPTEEETGFQQLCERAWSSGKALTIERFSGVLGHWVENWIYPFERRRRRAMARNHGALAGRRSVTAE